MAPGCLSEQRLAELVEGHLKGAALEDAERHLAICEDCRQLVASIAKALSSSGNADTEAPRHGSAASSVDRPLARNERVGRYVIRELVGSGAMGHVYAAQDPALDRKVALKLLRSDATSIDLESRLLREAKAMARTTHPNVVTVHDAGKHGDQVYIAMEFVEGGTLREWLAARRQPWREVLDVFLRAGRGLAQAHAAGLIHRDFKPDNVLVADDGAVVRVTDFGLARADGASDASAVRLEFADTQPEGSSPLSLDSPLTRTGVLVGTPVYMAPEQLAGEVADARSDLYSFAVALYEGLYGERPFSASTLAALLAAKRAGAVRAEPRETKVPRRVRRVLMTALNPDPAARQASMAILLDDLERAARTPRSRFVAAGVALLAAAAAASLPFAPARRAGHPSTSAPAVRCTSSVACIESQGCKALFEPGDLESADTVWLGALFPATGPLAEDIGRPNLDATDFARKEFARATGALTGAGASIRVRRIALVACDDADPEGARRAARHLVDDVGVPAIIGFRSGQEVVDLAGSLLVKRGVLSIATLTTNPLATRVPQPAEMPRMVWRTTFSIDDVAVATAGFLHDYFEPRRASPGATRVTLLRGAASGHVAFGQAVLKTLAFNGKSAIENGDAYQELEITSTGVDAEATRRDADRVAASAPSFVIVLLDPVVAVPLVSALEARWPTHAARPIYLVASNTLEPYASFLGKSRDRRSRTYSVVSASSSPTNASFVIRYNEAHERRVSRTENPGSSYDAFYWLAYAASLQATGPVTGSSLANAFDRLVPPGRAVEVGPTQVLEGVAELSRGGRIDVEGTSTSLDFDLARGEAPSDFALVCSDVDATGAAMGEGVESGVLFRAKTRAVEGTAVCP